MTAAVAALSAAQAGPSRVRCSAAPCEVVAPIGTEPQQARDRMASVADENGLVLSHVVPIPGGEQPLMPFHLRRKDS